MKPDLRDFFAAQVAAALAAEQRLGVSAIAARAYDVADALVAEREERLLAELAAAREHQLGEASGFEPTHLLDDAPPLDEGDDEMDPAWFDPSIRGRDDAARSRPPSSARPGLARTQLELPLAAVAGRKTGA